MRLIDADALKADLRESYNELKKIYDGLEHHEDRQICGGQLSTFLEAILRIKEAPTIDAVPVVRCKDCKHMAVVGVGFCWCKAWERMQTMGDDGFCCFGERRSE